MLAAVLGVLLATPAPAAPGAGAWLSPVAENLARLERECDRDGDKRITVRDLPLCRFQLLDSSGAAHPVAGVYPLAIAMQELALARDRGDALAALSTATLAENPVDRTREQIRGLFWDSLTRTIDEAGLDRVLEDPKAPPRDGLRRLYVPADDAAALEYARAVARRRPDLRLEVERLPERITPEYVRGLDGRHGLLALALETDAAGLTRGVPFVVPGGRFNELYGWDTHFIVLGLLAAGRLPLARETAEDQLYEVRRYGRILNANRTYYLTRSQPPFLTSTVRAIADRLPEGDARRAWLARGLEAAIAEYRGVWTAPPRLDPATGLSRYSDDGSGPCPEVEPGHYDPVVRPYAAKAGLSPAEYLAAYLAGRVREPALDAFFKQDRAVRESGHDTTYRWDDRAADFLTVDLNSLLYKTETDVAEVLEREFGGRLSLPGGGEERASDWRARAERRRATMSRLFWDPERRMFFDWDARNGRRSSYVSATSLYPLWAGWATPEQAAAEKDAALPELERLGGLAATSERSRGPLSPSRPPRQWDYPYGWAPHQILAWQGLRRYGFDGDARRLAYRWLWAVVKNARDYDGVVPEKLDVVKASHEVFAEYGNVGTKFSYITKEGFGWMNASYDLGLDLMTPELMTALRAQLPPDDVFKRAK